MGVQNDTCKVHRCIWPVYTDARIYGPYIQLVCIRLYCKDVW